MHCADNCRNDPRNAKNLSPSGQKGIAPIMFSSRTLNMARSIPSATRREAKANLERKLAELGHA